MLSVILNNCSSIIISNKKPVRGKNCVTEPKSKTRNNWYQFCEENWEEFFFIQHTKNHIHAFKSLLKLHLYVFYCRWYCGHNFAMSRMHEYVFIIYSLCERKNASERHNLRQKIHSNFVFLCNKDAFFLANIGSQTVFIITSINIFKVKRKREWWKRQLTTRELCF